ncbi:hypothetical protein D3C78_1027180 [compost metagenome]
MALHRQRRQAVGDDDGQVGAAAMGSRVLAQLRGRIGMQAPAEVGALQVGVAVPGGAVQVQAVETERAERLGQRGDIERGMHGVARLGVGELEVELRGGRQAGAGAAEGDARRGQVAQLPPGVLGGRGFVGHREPPGAGCIG